MSPYHLHRQLNPRTSHARGAATATTLQVATMFTLSLLSLVYISRMDPLLSSTIKNNRPPDYYYYFSSDSSDSSNNATVSTDTEDDPEEVFNDSNIIFDTIFAAISTENDPNNDSNDTNTNITADTSTENDPVLAAREKRRKSYPKRSYGHLGHDIVHGYNSTDKSTTTTDCSNLKFPWFMGDGRPFDQDHHDPRDGDVDFDDHHHRPRDDHHLDDISMSQTHHDHETHRYLGDRSRRKPKRKPPRRPKDKTKTSNPTIPSDCWPRLVMLPSFPTSGNGITQTLFSYLTGLLSGCVADVLGKELLFDWNGGMTRSFINYDRLGEQKIHSHLNSTNASNNSSTIISSNSNFTNPVIHLPLPGRVALVKTHHRAHSHVPQMKTLKKNSTLMSASTSASASPTHIIRLVRNPGDHLLRNFARWRNKDKNNKDYDRFVNITSDFDTCLRIVVGTNSTKPTVYKWMEFHESWAEASKHVPSTILLYEHITNLNLVDSKMEEVIQFVGEEKKYVINYTEVVQVPSYIHGTLFRDLCGIEMARKLHLATQNMTVTFGYTFDWEEGVWEYPS